MHVSRGHSAVSSHWILRATSDRVRVRVQVRGRDQDQDQDQLREWNQNRERNQTQAQMQTQNWSSVTGGVMPDWYCQPNRVSHWATLLWRHCLHQHQLQLR